MSDRPETGPMKFGDDWTGVFIRGDNAAGYVTALRALVAVFGIGWFALWDGLKVRVARYRVAQETNEMLREKFSELR
jgi:hypothetical protein